MTSYHNLQDQTYKAVIAEKISRIHGKPTWRLKERMKTELGRVAVEHKVSYDWSGGYGLLDLIIGPVRHAADFPHLPAFVFPNQPPAHPVLPGAPSQAQVRVAKDENNILKRDWAVVRGFCLGASVLIREALDSEYYEDLEHVVYGYNDVLPYDFIEHLEQDHCPLDEQATKEIRGHYFRGWERKNHRAPRP